VTCWLADDLLIHGQDTKPIAWPGAGFYGKDREAALQTTVHRKRFDRRDDIDGRRFVVLVIVCNV